MIYGSTVLLSKQKVVEVRAGGHDDSRAALNATVTVTNLPSAVGQVQGHAVVQHAHVYCAKTLFIQFCCLT